MNNINSLDEKIKRTFPEEAVYKTQKRYSIFAGKKIPSFIKDWLIKKFTDDNGNIDNNGLLLFMNKHIPLKDFETKSRLVNNKEPITILTRLIIEPDVQAGYLKFSIPDLKIKFNEGRIQPYIAKKFPELQGNEVWGVVTLDYSPPSGKDKGIIEIVDYKPFKPYEIDIEYFISIRNEYTINEWVDLLIRTLEYNPSGFDSLTQKLLFISRILVFVEPNLNLIELAPKQTGKSYIFTNFSQYCWTISGGVVSRTKLFYDMNKKISGLVTKHDVIAMDEIKTIKFTDEAELLGALKNYLESGVFTVGDFRGTGNTSFILLGNIPLNSELKPIKKQFLEGLPKFFNDSALLDRFHGFIEGWRLPKIKEDLIINGYALNIEFFTEVLHELRDNGEYESIVDDLLDIPIKADRRDVTAIKRMCSGYLKLLFPNVTKVCNINLDEFKNFCLNLALEKRSIIRNQLYLMDDEFKPEMPNIDIKRI